MIYTIRVTTKNEKDDLLGKSVLHLLREPAISKVRTSRVYRLENVSKTDATRLAHSLFCESVTQTYALNGRPLNEQTHLYEIAYKPGVMNPEVGSIVKTAKDMGIKLAAADSSTEYYFYGEVGKEVLDKSITKINLYNPTVEYIVKKEPKTLLIPGTVGKTEIIRIRKMTDRELRSLSEDTLFLTLSEMHGIQAYFKKVRRDPTDCELETLAQTWSEHCAHKTFKAKLVIDGEEKEPLFKRLKKEALKHDAHIVSAFVDNSGAMDFYDGYAICGKGETHNSPSAIEPYGGAMTGSGGVFRDIVGTGQGAKAIASTDIFCFAPPSLDRKLLPEGCLPPNYILRRVVEGVRDYGNRIGIPTNNGSIHFHPDFRAKPTVLVGAYGIVPKKQAKKGAAKIGDIVITVGGRTGRDGIHGATFSSASMTERTRTVNVAAVQIGNAVEEKRVFDALIQARDAGLIRAIQDCGAGGFSSAIGEMGETTGVTVHLEKALLKYQGMSPWEIWLSESQERMVIAVPATKVKKLLSICKKYNVEATVLGEFDGSKRLQVFYKQKKVCDLDMKFLHHGLPQRTMIGKKPEESEFVLGKKSPRSFADAQARRDDGIKIPTTEKDWRKVLTRIVSHGNICSKEPILRVYDHSVQGTNDLQPYSGVNLDAPNDAVVLRPLLNKPYGMVLAHGLNPVLNLIDPYNGSIWACAEALANYTAVGGDYREASLINNYVWPFPDEESLYTLNQSVEAVIDVMRALKIPVISGKDSLSSTYTGRDGTVIKIPPTLCLSVFGRIPNADKTITADFKKTDSVICLVGDLDVANMGGSVYFDTHHILGNTIPHIDLQAMIIRMQALYKAIQTGAVLSCHDVSEGGIFTSIFEMCIGGDMGAVVNLSVLRGGRPDYVLFNETAGNFIVELNSEETAKRLFGSTSYTVIGKTVREKTIRVSQKKKQLFTQEIAPLRNAWKKPMEEFFN